MHRITLRRTRIMTTTTTSTIITNITNNISSSNCNRT